MLASLSIFASFSIAFSMAQNLGSNLRSEAGCQQTFNLIDFLSTPILSALFFTIFFIAKFGRMT
jgi:hypothetical protein